MDRDTTICTPVVPRVKRLYQNFSSFYGVYLWAGGCRIDVVCALPNNRRYGLGIEQPGWYKHGNTGGRSKRSQAPRCNQGFSPVAANPRMMQLSEPSNQDEGAQCGGRMHGARYCLLPAFSSPQHASGSANYLCLHA